MNYRFHGFTQRKPQAPGVYFVSTTGIISGTNRPRRVQEGWDIAYIRFRAGFGDNGHEMREDLSQWRCETMSGISVAWKKGMWIKGPITPKVSP